GQTTWKMQLPDRATRRAQRVEEVTKLVGRGAARWTRRNSTQVARCQPASGAPRLAHLTHLAPVDTRVSVNLFPLSDGTCVRLTPFLREDYPEKANHPIRR